MVDERRSLVIVRSSVVSGEMASATSAGKAPILRGAKAGVAARELFNLGLVQDLYYGVADR